jgi:DNA-directed RNA polymerase specialized sigma24 family protein
LLRAWRELRVGAPSASARTWLYRLATDVCLEGLDHTDESRHPRSFDG